MVSYVSGQSHDGLGSPRNDLGISRDVLAVVDEIVLRTKVLYKTRLLSIRSFVLNSNSILIY
jgi:hypothetical protein